MHFNVTVARPLAGRKGLRYENARGILKAARAYARWLLERVHRVST